MRLEFRLYGRFHWPPVAGKAIAETELKSDVVPGLVSGTVEIHSKPKSDGSADHLLLLRWIPGKNPGFHPSDPDLKPPYLFDLGLAQAVKLFEKFDQEILVWLARSKPDLVPADKGLWLLFRGAFLFERYDAAGTTPDTEPKLQWPLVSQTKYIEEQLVHSGLGIGYWSKPQLYFNFHLPLPVRRTSLKGENLNPRTFPFTAVFDLNAASRDKLTELDALIGGWKANDELPEIKEKGKNFPFEPKNYPNSKRLGEFGFAEHGTGKQSFAIYGATDDTNHYWPLNKRAIVQDILWPYGFALDYKKEPEWLTATELGLADSSIRFRRPESGEAGQRSSLVYRASARRIEKTYKGKDDLRRDADYLRLRLSQELGGLITHGTQFGTHESNEPTEGWLNIGSEDFNEFSVDCELSWQIAHEHIWSNDRDSDWSPSVAITLHWKEEIPRAGIEAKPAQPQPEAGTGATDFKAGLLAHAHHAFQQARKGLEPGEAGRPHSFLPDLAANRASNTVRFALYGSPLAATFGDDGAVLWGRPAYTEEAPSPPWRRPPMRLSLAAAEHLIADAGETDGATLALSLTGSNVTFFQTAGVTFSLKLEHDPLWIPKTSEAVEVGEPFFASFQLKAGVLNDWEGRLSALQFRGVTAGIDDKSEKGHLRVGGRGARLGLGSGGPTLLYPNGRTAAEIALPLLARSVEPVSVDVARSDRTGRPGPLFISLDGVGDDSNKGAFWLKATETLSPTHDRRIKAEISENVPDSGIASRSYVVLSTEPFSVFQFTHVPLSTRGDASTTWVAYYSGDDRMWQYRSVSHHYHYVFPPQVIGESADKPRRLEIHDLVGDDLKETPPRPFVRTMMTNDKGEDVFDQQKSDMKRRAVEFRLTPPAEIWIRPSDVERGYFIPESASYEIFRQFGHYGVGAALSYLRAEFLYGLPVGIDVAKERSIARGARVAEIEALTGRLTGPADTGEAHLADRWNALRNTVARRPERLEIWARDLESDVDFTPARFRDGVQFALRQTALHRAPMIDVTPSADEVGKESDQGYTSLPRIGGLAPQVLAELEKHPRYHPQGLSGGALWPVESLNLFKAMVRSPQSRGGTIESIALSPFGGDAVQKAEFLGGKVTIISQTTGGYVERQQVEVLGRICALWHRAKHVVVYERTVNPTAQFAPKFDEDRNRSRSRRPILRKVREYIELLQPERGYPDFSTAAARSAGFLEGVRFNSKIINVDSAWAREVETFGWEIPLWNRLSARERPQVYPRPDIAFVSTAEGEAEKPVVAQECLDPDHLHFYADFSSDTTADTDTWPSRLNLDFPNMPAATAIAARADRKSIQDPTSSDPKTDPRRPSVGRILPGLRRFTWRLAPAAQKAALNAGRSGKPVYVGLESVSFMRATHSAEQHKELPAGLKSIPDIGHAPADLARLKYWSADGANGPPTEARKFAETLKDVSDAAKSGDVGGFKAARQTLYDFWTASKIKDELKSVAGSVKIPDKFKLDSALKVGGTHCAKLKSDAVDILQRKEMLVRTALQDWIAEADDFLKIEIFTPLKDDPPGETPKQTAIRRLKERAVEYVRPLFQEASKDIGKVEEGTEKARAVLLDLDAEIDATVERARRRIRQFVDGYDHAKPWSNERRKAFRAGLEASISSIQGDIVAAIEETRQRFAVELSDVSQAIGGHIAKALTQVSAFDDEALKNITTVKRLLAKADDTLAALLKADPDKGLNNLIDQVDKSRIDAGIKDTVKLRLEALRAPLTAAKKTVEEAQKLAAALDGLADEASATVSEAVEKAKAALTDVQTVIDAQAKELTEIAKLLPAAAAQAIVASIDAIAEDFRAEIKVYDAWTAKWFGAIDSQINAMVTPALAHLDGLLSTAQAGLRQISAQAQSVIDDAKQAMQYAQDVLAPDNLLETVVKDQIVGRALTTILSTLEDKIAADKYEAALKVIRARLGELPETFSALTRELKATALGPLEELTAVCNTVFEGLAEVEGYIETLATKAETYIDEKLAEAEAALKKKLDSIVGELPKDSKELVGSVDTFGRSVRNLHNDMSRAYETAQMYSDRVFDQFSKLDQGGIMAAPSNILKLYSAVTSAPEIAALKADIDRIRSGFDDLNDIIATTKANALFNRLGDELKAIGLSLPFDSIGDRLLPADLGKVDIQKVFRNFGGAKLDGLFKNYRMPAGLRDAIRVTHDFDKAQARAWVQIDIDAPMPGRRSLFSVGVFKADFLNMHLKGQVRIEASKDQDTVTQTGYGRIGTTIDLVVGGQSMVLFEKFGLSFTREKGLDVEFDPKNIKLNPSFKFIQDFLSTLFPDEAGGLEIIKRNGMPVGVQHNFDIPPISLNFGTSGISNISISNHFKLLAFPDFLIADRFNVSTIDRPFIFSIFIIGGTGYIQIDAEYRPFDSELMVMVEAGAGGSAQLAFSFGPFVGQVFITLSGTLTYRKLIGRPGGGLSISAVLVIVGNVTVAGIVTVCIVLVLRMTYRDNGQIDADGTLTVTIRISKFFKLSARAQAKYKMRGGKSETVVDASADASVESDEIKKSANKLKETAKKLEGARS